MLEESWSWIQSWRHLVHHNGRQGTCSLLLFGLQVSSCFAGGSSTITQGSLKTTGVLVNVAHQGKWGAVKMLLHLSPSEASNTRYVPAQANLQRIVDAWVGQKNIEAINWCHSHVACAFSVEAVGAAARNGHFAVLRGVWENRPDMCPLLYIEELFRVAVILSNLDTLRYMKARRIQVKYKALLHDSTGLGLANLDKDAGASQVDSRFLIFEELCPAQSALSCIRDIVGGCGALQWYCGSVTARQEILCGNG